MLLAVLGAGAVTTGAAYAQSDALRSAPPPGRPRTGSAVTTVLNRAAVAPAPARLGAHAARDRVVRTGGGLLLWAGLLLVTYWWDADGGITDLTPAGRPG